MGNSYWFIFPGGRRMRIDVGRQNRWRVPGPRNDPEWYWRRAARLWRDRSKKHEESFRGAGREAERLRSIISGRPYRDPWGDKPGAKEKQMPETKQVFSRNVIEAVEQASLAIAEFLHAVRSPDPDTRAADQREFAGASAMDLSAAFASVAECLGVKGAEKGGELASAADEVIHAWIELDEDALDRTIIAMDAVMRRTGHYLEGTPTASEARLRPKGDKNA